MIEPNAERLLVVDLAARSKNWALTPEGEQRIREATPDGWRVHVVREIGRDERRRRLVVGLLRFRDGKRWLGTRSEQSGDKDVAMR